MQNKVRKNSKVAQAPSTAIAVPLPLGGRLMLQPHNPLSVILSGGEAEVELLRIERSE